MNSNAANGENMINECSDDEEKKYEAMAMYGE